jgi:hypothetical protein
MMGNLRKKISITLLIGWGAIMTQLYQNCAPVQDGFGVQSSESNDLASTAPETDTGTGPGTATGTDGHPTAEKATTLPTRKQMVVPRTFVAGLVREVFTSANYPIGNLENLIDKWVLFKGGQYGGSCNFYSTYSTRDCGGSNSNANIGYYTDDNTARESFRIQLCENILGQNNGVNAALEKAGLTSASPVNAASVIAVYGLFYRDNPANPNVVNTLLDLNKSLAEKNATPMNIWRATLSQICESPGWQLL